jgi:hypothetical protein
MSQQNQYEIDDDDDNVIYGERKSNIEIVIPRNKNDTSNIISIADQYLLTYDVNGIITDGICKYDNHVLKCYHCGQQMELYDRNWYTCKFCNALQQK